MTIPTLRPFQIELRGEVEQAWRQGARNVVMRLDTGGGKTVTLASITRDENGGVAIIAHRQELVAQLSLTIARYGVRHDVIAAAGTVRAIARAHTEELGYSLYDPGSRVKVCSIDTLVRAELDPAWLASVTLWIVDEGHHLVVGNKWHAGVQRLPAGARGLLPTATPGRADGKGLGRHASGVADVMVQGPPMRWLIEAGYLTDYRVVCPPSDLELLEAVGASGDWSSKQLREAAERSHIVGDVVSSYLTYARGRLGITFATDVMTAGEMTMAYRANGVRAETLTGKTDDHVRRMILRRFAARELDQIVAVDIISEGFDLPAIEVASMARPTASLSLYMQQFGRALRTMPGKGKALILDHAANIIRHQGPPDKPRFWSLDDRDRRGGGGDGIPMKVCLGCYEPFPATKRVCPHCGHYTPPQERGSPKAVDGDMEELSADVLAQLRQGVDDVDKSRPERMAELMAKGGSHAMIMGNVNRHEERRQAQADLRAVMAAQGGRWHARGMTDSEMQRAFFFRYGMDVLSAQALGTKEARALANRIAVDPY